jgi:hypothetical protein
VFHVSAKLAFADSAQLTDLKQKSANIRKKKVYGRFSRKQLGQQIRKKLLGPEYHLLKS